ncbi:uncharacterized protein LOC112136505 [Oryzias melastigma]|uniref:uncharacterized protein LOC112136505 n=1 Tax=Oryzias melastigma TaxID=30732 RepID=UPI00168D5826|nr:uncharacterized protein LOC112136505 [Oryzias melastigma]
MGHKFGVNFQVAPEGDYFSNDDKIGIYLCKNSSCRLIVKDFSPHKNIQLPPPNITVEHAEETINVTDFEKPLVKSPYLQDKLEFEMALQRSNEIRNAFIKDHTTYFTIEKSALKPGAQYCVKVRRTVRRDFSYKAVWSDWSRSECWTNGKEPDSLLIILVKTLGPAGLSVVVLLCVCCSPTARMKIKTLSYTPSPVTFFQPLFQQDKGNLQEWFSKNGKFILTYKSEEDLRTDAVTIVPRTTTKELEEMIPDPCMTPLTLPVVFPGGQVSYVGLPGFHGAPAPVLNPGDSLYTKLPCPVWEFGISEGELASSPSENFLETSHADSGCNCEDLSRSPDCSLPSSPFSECPPLQYGQGYCILNRTTEGVVPVLVSKVEISSHVLQEKEQNPKRAD